MKVTDILSEQTKKDLIPTVRIKKGTRFSIQTLKANFLGQGVQTDAFAHPKGGNTVFKVIHIPIDADGFGTGPIAYVNAILKNPDNIFFPKIYKAKRYIWETEIRRDTRNMEDDERDHSENPDYDYDEKYNSILFVETEKLIPIDHAKLRLHSTDQVLASLGLTKKVIGDITGMDWDEHTFAYRMLSRLQFPMNIPELVKHITHPELKKALTILGNIPQDQYFKFDIKGSNFMFRLTSVGPN